MERHKVDASKLSGRVLILTDQVGAVAREIKHAVVRPDGRNEVQTAMADLVAQVDELCRELCNEGLVDVTMSTLLEQGRGRKERLELEAQAKGWAWI